MSEEESMIRWRLNSQLDQLEHAPLRLTAREFVRETGFGQLWKDWAKARRCLAEWEAKGFLRILADPEIAAQDGESNVACLEVYYYLDNKGCRPELLKEVMDRGGWSGQSTYRPYKGKLVT